MTLLQYKVEHFGKAFSDDSLQIRDKQLRLKTDIKKKELDSSEVQIPKLQTSLIPTAAKVSLWGADLVAKPAEEYGRDNLIRPWNFFYYNKPPYHTIGQKLNEQKKIILFKIDEKIIGSEKYKFLQEKYYKVQTFGQNSEISDDKYKCPKVFWVDINWVEPLNKVESYEKELCLKLLENFK